LGAHVFHADRRKNVQTDMTKLEVAFRNFANVSETMYVLPTEYICSFCMVLRSVIISVYNINMFRYPDRLLTVRYETKLKYSYG
jgi:hypothetical protein